MKRYVPLLFLLIVVLAACSADGSNTAIAYVWMLRGVGRSNAGIRI